MNKLIMLVTILLMVFIFTSTASALNAGHIYLPNGSTIDASNLTDKEIQDAIMLATKAMDISKNEKIVEVVKGINPEDLEQWRQVVTGTIKDICDDLSITVNEFVKTPVGAGIAIIVFYKFMGKDLLDNALDIIVITPLWFMLTGIILFLGWYFYHCKTVYEYRENANGKMEKINPQRMSAYAWKEKTDKSALAIALIVGEIGITVISLLLVLS